MDQYALNAQKAIISMIKIFVSQLMCFANSSIVIMEIALAAMQDSSQKMAAVLLTTLPLLILTAKNSKTGYALLVLRDTILTIKGFARWLTLYARYSITKKKYVLVATQVLLLTQQITANYHKILQGIQTVNLLTQMEFVKIAHLDIILTKIMSAPKQILAAEISIL